MVLPFSWIYNNISNCNFVKTRVTLQFFWSTLVLVFDHIFSQSLFINTSFSSLNSYTTLGRSKPHFSILIFSSKLICYLWRAAWAVHAMWAVAEWLRQWALPLSLTSPDALTRHESGRRWKILKKVSFRLKCLFEDKFSLVRDEDSNGALDFWKFQIKVEKRPFLSTIACTRGAKWATLLQKDAFEGRAWGDHEGSCVSPWVEDLWTLQGRLVVRLTPWWRFQWGNLLAGCHVVRELVDYDLRGGVVLLKPREPQPEWAKSSRLGDSVANDHGWALPCNERGTTRLGGYESLLGSLLACVRACWPKDWPIGILEPLVLGGACRIVSRWDLKGWNGVPRGLATWS